MVVPDGGTDGGVTDPFAFDGGEAFIDQFRLVLADGGTSLAQPLAVVTPEANRGDLMSQVFLVHVPEAGQLQFWTQEVGVDASVARAVSAPVPATEGLAAVVTHPSADGTRRLRVRQLVPLDADGDGRSDVSIRRLSLRHQESGASVRVSLAALFEATGRPEGVLVLCNLLVSVRDGEFYVDGDGTPRTYRTGTQAPGLLQWVDQGVLVQGPIEAGDGGTPVVAENRVGLMRHSMDGGIDVLPNVGDAPQGGFIVARSWSRVGAQGVEVIATAQSASNVNPVLIAFAPDPFAGGLPGGAPGSFLAVTERFILVDVPVRARVDGEAAFVLHCPPQVACNLSIPGRGVQELVPAQASGTTGLLLVSVEQQSGRFALKSYEWLPLSTNIAVGWPFALLAVDASEAPAQPGAPRQMDVSVVVARRDGAATVLEEIRRRHTWTNGVREVTAEVTHAFARVGHPAGDSTTAWEDRRHYVSNLEGTFCDGPSMPPGICPLSDEGDRFMLSLLVPVNQGDVAGPTRYVPVSYERERKMGGGGAIALEDDFFVAPQDEATTVHLTFPDGDTAARTLASQGEGGMPTRISMNVSTTKRLTSVLWLVPDLATVSIGNGPEIAVPKGTSRIRYALIKRSKAYIP